MDSGRGYSFIQGVRKHTAGVVGRRFAGYEVNLRKDLNRVIKKMGWCRHGISVCPNNNSYRQS